MKSNANENVTCGSFKHSSNHHMKIKKEWKAFLFFSFSFLDIPNLPRRARWLPVPTELRSRDPAAHGGL